VSWLSPGLQQRQGMTLDCLRGRAGEALSHDNYFHTVLGLMDVKTQVYQPALDALAPCESARGAVKSAVKSSPAS
jgi:lipid A ethanolaminephosphotransferase